MMKQIILPLIAAVFISGCTNLSGNDQTIREMGSAMKMDEADSIRDF